MVQSSEGSEIISLITCLFRVLPAISADRHGSRDRWRGGLFGGAVRGLPLGMHPQQHSRPPGGRVQRLSRVTPPAPPLPLSCNCYSSLIFADPFPLSASAAAAAANPHVHPPPPPPPPLPHRVCGAPRCAARRLISFPEGRMSFIQKCALGLSNMRLHQPHMRCCGPLPLPRTPPRRCP